jgi:hypothetical protein
MWAQRQLASYGIDSSGPCYCNSRVERQTARRRVLGTRAGHSSSWHAVDSLAPGPAGKQGLLVITLQKRINKIAADCRVTSVDVWCTRLQRENFQRWGQHAARRSHLGARCPEGARSLGSSLRGFVCVAPGCNLLRCEGVCLKGLGRRSCNTIALHHARSCGLGVRHWLAPFSRCARQLHDSIA